ncbi:MAG: helix-turn-helix domain-containing protein [Mycolicibacterium sp.]|uniref:PucR family transcriptional regulator n=1 Tax=Mycolicibacterium insubricum TaxID=444597 RepID=A0A1X0D9L2_9MYCO|nr:helix-turn-helix domain-containing protein [Mycolicibacterium insubricum]MCB9438780.1 helix-turn-helix domain-containing protein [Mycolicibacterium sp.]MCV7084141.1 helix-turn-helix domain-containing protein [Mycolicibacterium insubricum]ORA69073.1 PucR family transcriptional regulator [Mycolicibacterium insubricum]
MPRTDHDTAVSDAGAVVVRQLADRLDEVTAEIQQYLIAEIDELRGDATLLDLLRDSVEGNVATIFAAAQHTIPIEPDEPPLAALEYARRLAQRGVAPNALVRAYRLGQQRLLALVAQEIRRRELDPTLELDVFDEIATVTFIYIDWISQRVVETYQDERDRWLENRNNMRAVRIREILRESPLDVDAVEQEMQYPFGRYHLALMLWFDSEEAGNKLGRLEQHARELAGWLGAGEPPLFVATDRITGWAWIPLSAQNARSAPVRIRQFRSDHPDQPEVAAGAALPGITGFRYSHQLATYARSVAQASGTPPARITSAAEPGLVAAALLGSDLAQARTWVQMVLGPLVTDTEPDARLRNTLRLFLQAGSSFKGASEVMNLHANSVKYRVQRAIERRGMAIDDDRLDVEIALLMCAWYGTAMLKPAG